MEQWIPYLIICPLVFVAGIVDAVAGGGGLISLPAYLMSGIPVHMAIGTNKMSACMGTALATWRFSRNGYIAWKQALACAVFALVGSALGANIALLIEADVFTIIMLVVLPLTALYVLRGKSFAEDLPPHSFRKTTLLGMGIAFVVGIYDGFYGPGTGVFLLLLLTGVAHLKLKDANGVAKVINLSTNVAALTVFLLNGKILLGLGLTAGAFSIAGNYIGTKIFEKSGAKSAKPIIIFVLVVFFIKIIVEQFL